MTISLNTLDNPFRSASQPAGVLSFCVHETKKGLLGKNNKLYIDPSKQIRELVEEGSVIRLSIWVDDRVYRFTLGNNPSKITTAETISNLFPD